MSNPISSSVNKSKEAAGSVAAQLVKDGMLVGLGTGTTAAYFINSLILRCRQGLKVTAVATSKQSAELALKGGIPLLDVNSISQIDLTVDGADQINAQKTMIKGGGGALLREKIIASSSREMIVIVDETKLVDQFSGFPLPVEIVPFGYNMTLHKLKKLGYEGQLRENSEGSYFLTDNGNYIFDISFQGKIENPLGEEEKISKVPGVVTTGFFFNLAGRIIIGFPDGTTEIRS